MTAALVVLAVLAVLLVISALIYNGLVRRRNQVDGAWSQIDGQLRRRHDLVPDLVETVQSHAGHERGTLDAVTEARARAVGAQGPADQAAAENALLLAEVCPTVTLVHRGTSLRARREFTERLQSEHRVTVFKESNVLRIIGEEAVEAVEILRRGAIKPFQMAVRGVLVRIGVEPRTELFRDQIHLDERGYVVVTGEQETSIGNVFAVGDISNPLAPTISGACGAGATAAKVIAARLNQR